MGREALAGVLILIDVRRGPQEEELMLGEFLSTHEIGYAWVLTKCDKLKKGALRVRLGELGDELDGAVILPTSGNAGTGTAATGPLNR